jgi:hypothetical protein
VIKSSAEFGLKSEGSDDVLNPQSQSHRAEPHVEPRCRTSPVCLTTQRKSRQYQSNLFNLQCDISLSESQSRRHIRAPYLLSWKRVANLLAIAFVQITSKGRWTLHLVDGFGFQRQNAAPHRASTEDDNLL